MFLSISRLPAVAAVVLGLVVALSAPRAHAAAPGGPPANVRCRSCLVVADGGEQLWSRGADRRLPNASTTKMLTALLVARRAEVDDQVTVSPWAAMTGGGGLDLMAGDRHSVLDLLYALLLTSSNDAAVALAEHTSGTEARFVKAMNRVAFRLGAERTRFLTPHGLDAPGHLTTARDLATIAGALLAEPLLADIVNTESIVIQGADGPIPLKNRNVLLETYKGAVGVKTGYTERAGQVLVAAARRHGRRLIAVALGSRDAAADSRKLLDYGWLRLRRTVLVRAGSVVGRVVFDPAGSVAAAAARTLRGPENPTHLELSLDVAATARPVIERGDHLGEATLATGSIGPQGKPGEVVGAVPSVAAGNLSVTPPNPLIEALGAILRWGDRAARAMR
jgi:D-alanyl-D-alanine carboxypeptidase (penicillin-binding protein 5/6)